MLSSLVRSGRSKPQKIMKAIVIQKHPHPVSEPKEWYFGTSICFQIVDLHWHAQPKLFGHDSMAVSFTVFLMFFESFTIPPDKDAKGPRSATISRAVRIAAAQEALAKPCQCRILFPILDLGKVWAYAEVYEAKKCRGMAHNFRTLAFDNALDRISIVSED